MRRLPPSFDASVSAFREMTAMPPEGDATRARVLAHAGRDARRRSLLRGGAMPLAIAVVILCSGAALTAAGLRWRAPRSVGIGDAASEGAPIGRRSTAGPTRIVPAAQPASAPSRPPDPGDGERLAYERAHRAHFFAEAPARALAAWDAYLAGYPRGTFAPEARYNRAVCLVRLGRFAAAADGLRPFAAGRLAGYRRQEACLLLRWLAERDARLAPEPRCAAGD